MSHPRCELERGHGYIHKPLFSWSRWNLKGFREKANIGCRDGRPVSCLTLSIPCTVVCLGGSQWPWRVLHRDVKIMSKSLHLIGAHSRNSTSGSWQPWSSFKPPRRLFHLDWSAHSPKIGPLIFIFKFAIILSDFPSSIMKGGRQHRLSSTTVNTTTSSQIHIPPASTSKVCTYRWSAISKFSCAKLRSSCWDPVSARGGY